LCIDQFNVDEVNQEVPKMRQYYNNADATLIAINTEVKFNVNKKEFALEQTIFMFDDGLVDGRTMAQVWAFIQQRDFSFPCQIKLGLSQCLEAIKSRGRDNPIDGIYSILGLLSYGNKIIPKYKEWGHQYTKKELGEALLDVMKAAVEKDGYSEILAWFGPRRNEINLWPGSAEVTGSGIKLIGSQHIVKNRELASLRRLEGSIERGIGEACFLFIENQVMLIILVPSVNNPDCPIDIFRLKDYQLSDNSETLALKKIEEKELFIDMVNKKVIKLGTEIAIIVKDSYKEEEHKQLRILLRIQSQLINLSVKNGIQNKDNPLVKENLEEIKREVDKYIMDTEEIYKTEEERIKVKMELERAKENRN
ncbi:4166_t:CDS:2, partial [Racocetra persica]